MKFSNGELAQMEQGAKNRADNSDRCVCCGAYVPEGRMVCLICEKGEKKMTVYEFCRHKTQAHQLCVIRDSGWIVEAVWIDHEDLFRMSDQSQMAEVKSTEFGELPIMTEHGDKIHVPCLYIDT